MSQLLPAQTTLGDVVNASLRECGAVGRGQTALPEDFQDAWARLQWMIQQWERKRWMVYHLKTYSIVSTGAVSYTMGPGGQIDTGPQSVRPARIESAFLRQLVNSAPNQVDYPLQILQSMEDYNRIALKSLVSFPTAIFMDTAWPLANVFPWPVPNANIYAVFVTVMEQLPNAFGTQAVDFVLPYEYYEALLYNLAVRLRSLFGIGSFPGDPLPTLAKNSLNTIISNNTQIAKLTTPELGRPNNYNIFSDRFN